LFSIASLAPVLAAEPAETWDGLVEVKPKHMDMAFVLPGADFRPYARVLIDPTQVAFRKDWLRAVNRSVGVSRRITEEDAAEIMDAAHSNFDDLFHDAFAEAGYPLAEGPGPDVLRISTAIVNLDVRAPAPDQGAGRTVTLVATAREATLILEARDSQAGALLGRVIDRRETRQLRGRATTARNLTDFQALFRQWGAFAPRA
jgi:hypothetical protein